MKRVHGYMYKEKEKLPLTSPNQAGYNWVMQIFPLSQLSKNEPDDY